jgi:transposase
VVISGLFGASGRRFLDALVAGERSPAALAALGDPRLKASPQQLTAALTGRFREVRAFEIVTHLRLIDAINEEISRLDARIEQQLASIPGVARPAPAAG